MLDVILTGAVAYLSAGVVVLLISVRRNFNDDRLDLGKALEHAEYPNGPPLFLRLAKIIGSGLAVAVGLIGWPVILWNAQRHRRKVSR